jgi:tRNA(Ile2) C34 agmatinyltransferase TiaS
MDRNDYQVPYGKSALRKATRHNPRNKPCPTCGQQDKLTQADVNKGYQCDDCADRDEGLCGER